MKEQDYLCGRVVNMFEISISLKFYIDQQGLNLFVLLSALSIVDINFTQMMGCHVQKLLSGNE